MMTTHLVYAVLAWMSIGICVLGFILLTELLALLVRGEEIMTSLADHKHVPRTLTDFLWNILHFAITWPIPLMVWFRAAWNKQTMGEFVQTRVQEIREQQTKIIRVLRQKIKDSERKWFAAKDGKSTFMAAFYSEPQPFLMISHSVMTLSEGFAVLRLNGSDLKDSLPFTIETTLELACEAAENDIDWQILCFPGLEDLRQKQTKEINARLSDGVSD